MVPDVSKHSIKGKHYSDRNPKKDSSPLRSFGGLHGGDGSSARHGRMSKLSTDIDHGEEERAFWVEGTAWSRKTASNLPGQRGENDQF